MKTPAILLSLLVLAATFGASAAKHVFTPEEAKLMNASWSKLTPEQRVKRAELLTLQDMQLNGGEMVLPGTPAGKLLFVNLQKRVPVKDLEPLLENFVSTMAYDVKIVDADAPATLKIKIVDDPAAPSVLVAPDDHWAQVNVAKLGDATTKPAYLAARTRKSVLRAFSALVAGSAHGTPLFAPVRKPADLDKAVEDGLPIDLIMRARRYLSDMRMKPLEYSTYRSVLQLGYEVAPTNEFQKAIYDEVKARKAKKAQKSR